MKRPTTWTVCLALLLLAGCGSGFTLGMGTVTVLGLAPGQTILCGDTEALVQFAGSGFLSEHGLDVQIRWTATEGTPFEGGTSATTETSGTVLSDSLFEAELPDVFGTIPVLVTIILPGGNEGTSPPVTLEIGGELGPPTANSDAYGAIGNVPLTIAAATGVLFNDEDGECIPSKGKEEDVEKVGAGSPGMLTTGTVVSYDNITALGGTVVMQPDGSFVYTPPLGAGAAQEEIDPNQDTFTYTLEQGGRQSTGLVTIDICETIWFIDDTVPPGGTGQMDDAFSSLSEFMSVQGGPGTATPEEGDWIFVYEGSGSLYDGGIVLLDGQKLIGQGVNLVVCGQTVVSATTNPLLTNQLGESQALHCIVLGNGNRIDGLDVVNPQGDGIHGFDVSGPTTVDHCRITGCGNDGVHLEGALNGPFDFGPETEVDQCDGTAVRILGQRRLDDLLAAPVTALTSGGFTFEGDISQTDTGPAIEVVGTAPGTSVAFQGGMIAYEGNDFAAITLEALSGTFTCTSPQTFLGSPFICVFITESDGTFTFGDTTIDVFDDARSSSGIELLNVGAAAVSFDDLSITIEGDDEAIAGGVGIRCGNLGTSGQKPGGASTPSAAIGPTDLSVTGTSSITMTDAEDACIIFADALSPFVLDMTFTSISVDGSPQGGGLFLSDCSGTFDVTGTTTIANFDGAGILFLGGDCDLTFATLNVSNGSGVAGRGIDINDNAGTCTINGGTFDVFAADAVIVADSNLALSNVAFSNVTLDVLELNGTCTVSGSGNTAATFGNLCNSAGATVTGSISFTNPAVSCP